MSIPRITDDDRSAINTAIAAAESKTAAEIVPVVAESSGRYDRAEDLCGLWLGLIFMIVTWLLLPEPFREPGSWGGPSLLWYPFSLTVAVVIGFVLGIVISNRLPGLRRLFTPGSELQQEVANRSRQVFFDQRVRHTAGHGGILLYVSLFERRAAIIADRSVLDALTQPTIDSLCAEFTNRLKTGSLKDAFVETIADVGNRLSSKLPAGDDDRNELPDALVTLSGF